MILESILDSDVKVYLVPWKMSIYLTLQSYETQRPCYIYIRGDYDVLHRIEEKVLNTIYAWVPLKFVNVF